MNDIETAIADFVWDDSTLSDSTRNDARRELRSMVGENIFDFDRRPQGTGDCALTIGKAGGPVLDGLSEVPTTYTPIIDLTIWGKDNPDDPKKFGRAYRAARQLFQQYRGPLNKDTNVQTMHLQNEPFVRPVPPKDGSDDWAYRYVLSFLVVHD